MDETFVTVKGKKLKVVVPADKQTGKRLKQGGISDYHMSLIVCVSADAVPVSPPTIIVPMVSAPPAPDHILMSYNWAGSEKGWITSALFEAWIQNVFIPHVTKVRSASNVPNEKALLWLDAHSSRLNENAQKLLRDNNIVCATIPAHTSHILQPLDCGIFNVFKNALRRYRNQGLIPVDKGVDAYRSAMLTYTLGALHDAFNALCVRKAWETTGLFPWNPERVWGDPNKVAPVDTISPPPERPTILQQISGKVVTPELITAARLAKEAEKARIEEEKAERRRASELARNQKKEEARHAAEEKKAKATAEKIEREKLKRLASDEAAAKKAADREKSKKQKADHVPNETAPQGVDKNVQEDGCVDQVLARIHSISRQDRLAKRQKNMNINENE